MEWLLEDSFGIEDVTKGSESTPHACARWFSCENGLFVLVVGIGSLIHLYSLVETSSKERSFKEELMSHRYKKITTIETRSYATPSELGELQHHPSLATFTLQHNLLLFPSPGNFGERTLA